MKTKFVLLTGLCFLLGSASIQAEKVVEKSSKGWKYLDKKDDPAKDWNTIEFDDSKWSDGQAPLGYGDDDIKTTISFGEDEEDKIPFALFRRTVEIKDPKNIGGLAGFIQVDDGAVVYVNGKEVYRINLPEGKITPSTNTLFAKGDEMERMEHKFAIPSEHLKEGKNVIAVEVHQISGGSSDLALDMELKSVEDKEEFKETKKAADADHKALMEQVESALQNADGDAF